MKKISALLIAVVMVLSFAACGGGPNKQPAIDAFNSCSDTFDETSAIINANVDIVDPELTDQMIALSATLTEYKTALEGNDLTQDELDQMVEYFQTTESNLIQTKEILEADLADYNAQ